MGNDLTYKISPAERAVSNRGYGQPKLSLRDDDEFSAIIVERLDSDLSIYYNENSLLGNSISKLIDYAAQVFEKFKFTADQKALTKYRYAELYLKIYSKVLTIERQTTTRLKDGTLLETYRDWVADPDKPGQTKIISKVRPWTTSNPKTVNDIPAFKDEKVKSVQSYIIKTNPGLIEYDDPNTTPSGKSLKPTKHSSKNNQHPSHQTSAKPNQNEKEVGGAYVTFKATPHLIKLFTEKTDYDYPTIRVEVLALGIQALSTKQLDIEKARKIAKEYLNKYVDSNKKFIADKFDLRAEDLKIYIHEVQAFNRGGSDNATYIPVSFSAYSILNLYYEYHVQIDENIIKELNGELQKELNKTYQLDKIQRSLEHYFQTLERKDFAEVIHNVANSRSLMVMYLEDEYVEQEAKRGSRFFKAFEAALFSHEFPGDYKSFFAGIGKKTIEIHELIRNDNIERAIAINKEIHEVFLEARKKLNFYQQDKQKWGSRALFLITLALDLAITYLTAGFTKMIPARAGLLVNLLLPAVKQELYLQIGLIEKRDFKEIGIGAVTNVATMKVAVALSTKLSTAYNIPIGRFKSIVIDNLLVNFSSAFQEELIALGRKKLSLDDFLSELLKNFVSGVLHEKVAKIAIERFKNSRLDLLIKKNDPSVLSVPDRNNHNHTNSKVFDKDTSSTGIDSKNEIKDGQAVGSKGLENNGSSKINIGSNPKTLINEEIHPGAQGSISKAPIYKDETIDLSHALGVGLFPLRFKRSWTGYQIRFNTKAISIVVGHTQKDVKKAISYIKRANGLKSNDQIIINRRGEVYLNNGKYQFLHKISDAIKEIEWPKKQEARTRLIGWIALYGKDRAKLILNSIVERHKLREALKLDIEKAQAHHLIPVEILKTNEVAQAAIAAGFEFNSKNNALPLPRSYHLQDHDEYNLNVQKMLSDWAEENKGFKPGKAREFIEQEVIPICVAHLMLGHPLERQRVPPQIQSKLK